MEPDYPAAHSMDTQWFAVDRDGHVASFNSGEAGAVPVQARHSDNPELFLLHLRDVLPSGPLLFDPEGRRRPGSEEMPEAWPGGYPILLFLTSLDPVRELIDSGRALEVAATRHKAVLLNDGLTEEEAERIHALGEFQGSYNLFFTMDESAPHEFARYGFYEYGHLTENWISGPYGREAVPVQPLHIDQLPPALRRSLSRLRLDKIRFADTLFVQPLEHTECVSHEAAYTDVDCKLTLPVPGKEEEFAETYGDSDFEAEPPPTE